MEKLLSWQWAGKKEELTLRIIPDPQPVSFPENEKTNVNGGILLMVRPGGLSPAFLHYTVLTVTMGTVKQSTKLTKQLGVLLPLLWPRAASFVRTPLTEGQEAAAP